MAPISLALVWHQHQPYYPDDVGGENPMPWVRLHATKDYLGMALHLLEVPEFRCTINLVPSLLAQLEAYVDGASDDHLTLSRRPADDLTAVDACAVLDSFFMAFPDTMIRPHPRYHELYLLRSSWNSPARQALARFRPRDLRDLQVWSNLAWIHPLVFEKDLELAEFRAKGKYYTEEEKAWLLGKQRELLARVIPLHRELAERGQVQVSINMTNYKRTPLHRVFECVRSEAERFGVPIVGSEIVGLTPADALFAAAEHYLRLESPPGNQVLEMKLLEE